MAAIIRGCEKEERDVKPFTYLNNSQISKTLYKLFANTSLELKLKIDDMKKEKEKQDKIFKKEFDQLIKYEKYVNNVLSQTTKFQEDLQSDDYMHQSFRRQKSINRRGRRSINTLTKRKVVQAVKIANRRQKGTYIKPFAYQNNLQICDTYEKFFTITSEDIQTKMNNTMKKKERQKKFCKVPIKDYRTSMSIKN